MLWVGNSFFYYNNSMHGHFGQLVTSLGEKPAVRGTSVTISGSGLDWHDMESLVRPNGLGRYSFVGDNEIKLQPAGPPVRHGDHDGLQPVPHPPAVAAVRSTTR
jgi:hypothetical protein